MSMIFRLRSRTSLLLALLCLTVPGLARASEASSTPPSPNTAPNFNPGALFAGDNQLFLTGALENKYDSWYLNIRPMLDLKIGAVSIGIAAPIALLSPFPTPTSEAKDRTYFGFIRSDEWPVPGLDNYGQYLQLIRYVEYGRKRDPVYVRYGQLLASSIGHSTLVDRYSNSLDATNLRPGLAFDITTHWGGFETLVDSLAFPNNNIIAARVFVRPLAFTSESEAAEKLAVGFSVVEDRRAPRSTLASDGSVLARDGVSATAFGIDVEYALLNNDLLTLVPYADLNFQTWAKGSLGAHLGALATFDLASLTRLFARFEYRAMQPRYIPNYFDVGYDLQRSMYPVGDLQVAKATAPYLLAPGGNNGLGSLRHGLLGELSLDIVGMLQGGVQYFATPGVADSGNLTAFATLQGLDTIKLTAFYTRRNFDTFEELIDLDERSLLSLVAMYKLWGPLWLTASANRAWSTNPDTGKVTAQNEYQVGLTTHFTL